MEDILKQIIGKSLSEARRISKENGYDTRVSLVDGRVCMITDDIRNDRIDLIINNDIVTNANIQ